MLIGHRRTALASSYLNFVLQTVIYLYYPVVDTHLHVCGYQTPGMLQLLKKTDMSGATLQNVFAI